MAPYSSTLAWKIPWMEEPGRLQSMGLLRVGHDWATSHYFSLLCIGEGNGNPLQCSCLENPRDGGAWWSAVYGLTQSQTRLKWLSGKYITESTRKLIFPLVLVGQLCPALCYPVDCSLPDSLVHEILQTRILEWVDIPFSRRYSWHRDRTWVSFIADSFFNIWANRVAQYFD